MIKVVNMLLTNNIPSRYCFIKLNFSSMFCGTLRSGTKQSSLKEKQNNLTIIFFLSNKYNRSK